MQCGLCTSTVECKLQFTMTELLRAKSRIIGKIAVTFQGTSLIFAGAMPW